MAATPPASPIPAIHLLCMEERFITAFNAASTSHHLPASTSTTIHNERLASLPSTVKFDAIVSPANSFARLDGGFDDALSRAFSPKQDYHALTRVSQSTIYKEWRGFAPPGTCTLIDLNNASLAPNNPWGCRYMALCPTMKEPQNVVWDREVVFECVWSLLATIDRHNRAVKAGEKVGEKRIDRVLMTPLATGCGRWSAERWAAQLVLAIRQFVEAVERPEKWAALEWGECMRACDEVEKTYGL